MSKFDRYFRVILNHNSNDWNDEPEYKIQMLFTDDKHKKQNLFKTGNGEWRVFSDSNPIYSDLTDACSKLIARACNDKNKKIKELQQKLAESEKNRLMWQEMYKSADKQNKEICETDIYPLQEQIQQLKQQLAETDKLMQEYLSKCLSLEQQLTEKDELLKQKISKMKSTDFIRMCVDCGFMVQAKEIDNQTAIAELEKVKELIKNNIVGMGIPSQKHFISPIINGIDQQIKSLKGEE